MKRSRRPHRRPSNKNRSNSKRTSSRRPENAFDYNQLEVRNLLAGVSGMVYANSTDLVQLDQPVALADGMQLLRDHLQLGENESMELVRIVEDSLGNQHFKYQQTYNGLKVENSIYTLHTEGSEIVRLSGESFDMESPNYGSFISEEAALEKALEYVGAEVYAWQSGDYASLNGLTGAPEGELLFLPQDGEAVLTYKFDIYAFEPFSRAYIYVDAASGEIARDYSRIRDADVPGTGTALYEGAVNFTADEFDNNGNTEYRLRQAVQGVETFDLDSSTDLGDAEDITHSSADFTESDLHQKGVQAHYAAETTYNYFLDTYGLDSYDGMGSTLRSYVAYGPNIVNAFWTGTEMLYGDGDGTNFGPLVSMDIAGHEIGHGVTEFSSNLVYQDEPGALNESFSDIFGELVEDYGRGGGGANDWLLGDDIGIGGSGAIRSMSDPNQFGDPDTYLGDFWWTSPGDFGGVHTNSGVQNKWFYILSEGESGVNDNGDVYDVVGLGIDDAAAIAYRANSIYLSVNSQYQDARDMSVQAAIDLFGSGSQQHVSTSLAWRAVGVYGPEIFISEMESSFEGSAVYTASFNELVSPGITDSVRIELNAGQTLSMAVVGEPGLMPTFEVFDESNNSIATSTNYDTTSFVQNVEIATEGLYVIEVGGLNDTTGGYGATIVLNASLEVDNHGMSGNDTMADAEVIDGSSMALGADSDRVAVVGEFSKDEVEASFEEDFETGVFSDAWETNSSTASGRIRLLGDYGTAGGSFAMVMDQAATGVNNLNEAIWTVDLAGAQEPILSFSHAEWNDETTPLPAAFNNSRIGDGVSISANGTTWYTILTNTDTPAGEWNRVEINLKEAAENAGISLGENFKIKFQQYDDGMLSQDGRGYDEISIVTDSVVQDWYAFQLAPGEIATIAAEEINPGSEFGLELFDSEGNLIGNSFVPSQQQSISRFENTTDSSDFFVKLSGSNNQYTLLVTRNADFDMEGPESFESVDSILGFVSAVASEVAEPDAYSSGSEVSSAFPGVTLSNTAGGGVYAVEVSYGAPTGNTIFSPAPGNFAGWQEGVNELRADFDTTQSMVSIDVGSDDGANDVGFLRAYDMFGNMLDEATSGSLAPGEFQKLTVMSSLGDIAYVMAGGYGNDVAPLDNLVYQVSDEVADVYTFDVTAGTQLDISANLIGIGPNLFDNGLETDTGTSLELGLYAPDGSLAASSADTIDHLTMQDGIYSLVVTSSEGSGEYYLSTDVDFGRLFNIGDTGLGIAVDDFATGTGYIMYSVENLHERFSNMWPDTSQHLVAVRYNPTSQNWEYNANTFRWYSFELAFGDRLIAEVDFDNDTIMSLQGASGHVEMMNQGFAQNDLTFMADRYAGVDNDGEFRITGNYFVVPGKVDTVPVSEPGLGIAVDDHATGSGYILYSEQRLSDRFDNRWEDTSEHLVAVRYDATRGVWQYNANLPEWFDFDITTGDRLVATVDFDSDTVKSLQGASGTVHGIYQGYLDGDLLFRADHYAGVTNDGEFEVFGSFFQIPAVETSTTDLGDTGLGIAVEDGATGTGYIMYSSENVFTRFTDVWPDTAQHLIAVRYNSGTGTWEYNGNLRAWYAFTPVAGDRLLAEVDFDDDIVTALRGVDEQENGMDKGFYDGDIDFQANQYAGTVNDGEFSVTGTYFELLA